MLKEGKIILRPFYDTDAQAMALLANNKIIWDNLRDHMPFPYCIGNAVSFIALAQKENPPLTFAIEYDGQFCGVIGLVGQSDVYKRTAEIGYWVGEPYWNKGIATVSVKLLTEYGFDQLDFIRIHTGIFENNIASMNVLKKMDIPKTEFLKSQY